jgi:hypothetical protein
MRWKFMPSMLAVGVGKDRHVRHPVTGIAQERNVVFDHPESAGYGIGHVFWDI